FRTCNPTATVKYWFRPAMPTPNDPGSAMLKRYLTLFLLTLLPLCSGAAQPQDLLQQFVHDVTSASGVFSQVQVGEDGDPVAATQTGTFSFQRPGKFKWL